MILAAILAAVEYRGAGGWPVRGFSQGTGIHEARNWIVYLLGALLLIVAARGWFVFGNKPISERRAR